MNTHRGAGSGGPGPSWRPKNPMASFQHALEGLAHAFRTQRNMRFHICTLVCVLIAGILLRLPRAEILILLFSASLVLITEMFNTAVEAVVDMVTPNYHPGAKFAKDIAAGAVLIAAINAAVVGFAIFTQGVRLDVIQVRLRYPPTFLVLSAAFLLMMVIILVGKILGQKGTLVRGGVISGHAAVAFFIAGTILFVVNSFIISALALFLAALVAQSRVEARIHTLQEVALGAFLALALTVIVYRLPGWIGSLLPRGGPPASAASP